MIKKITLSFALLTIFSVPLFTHALTEKDLQSRIDELLKQLTALQEKLIALQNPPQSKIPTELPAGGSEKLTACEYIAAALQRGSTDAATGGDVTKLQRFLASLYKLDIRDIVTGFYGAVTEGHVARFQRENGLPEVGSVGPLTRAHIARMCGIKEPSHACLLIAYQQPLCKTGEHVESRRDAFGCEAAPVCVPDTKTDVGDKGKSAAPIISGVSGPTTLGIGQTGTWTVNATDPSVGTLSYSVQWGDAGALGELTKIAGGSFDTFVQSATFSHAYGRAGVFVPRFTVRSASGMAAVTSVSVNVGTASTETGATLYDGAGSGYYAPPGEKLYDGVGSGYYGPGGKLNDGQGSGYYGTGTGDKAACPPLYERQGSTCAAF